MISQILNYFHIPPQNQVGGQDFSGGGGPRWLRPWLGEWKQITDEGAVSFRICEGKGAVGGVAFDAIAYKTGRLTNRLIADKTGAPDGNLAGNKKTT